MNKKQRAEQIRKALQLLAAALTEEEAMEVATVYDPWTVGHAYKLDEYLTYGTNSVGDPQLYRCIQAHTSQADWTPDLVPALFKAVGIDEQGYPEWSQPTGAADAYNTGDIVDYKGTLYISTIDGNVWAPDVYPQGWAVYTPTE